MVKRFVLIASCIALSFALTPAESWGRGFGGARGGGGGGMRGGGGGGFSGGGMRAGGMQSGGISGGGMRGGPGGFSGGGFSGSGFSGGGFSGGGRTGGNFSGGGFSGGGVQGANFSGGGFQGGGRTGSNFSGGGFSGGGTTGGGFEPGGFNRGGFNASGLRDAGGLNGGQGAGGFDRITAGGLGAAGIGAAGLGAAGGRGGEGFSGFRGDAPNNAQLGNFLGLPSDEGMHSFSGQGTGRNGNVDFNYGAAEGPRGGAIGGISATGPNDNTVGRAGALGPNGGVAGARGFEGANGAGGIQAAGVGAGGRFAAGEGVRGPNGGAAARGIAAGPAGVAGGYARISPSGRYTCAAGVRTNFNRWGMYGGGWYTDHPGAWYAAGWAAGAVWSYPTWNSLGAWMSYYPAQPVYYDYGTNVTYQDGNVYVGDQSVGTSQEYYDQAAQVASTGAAADASTDEQWLPLGVFAFTKPEEPSNNLTLQLAVNKQGIIRGNYTDSTTGTTQLVQGAVDKQTQRAAFTIGDQTQDVVETGIYNLTKDEAPVLIHFGKERTEQWLLVRLKNPEGAATDSAAGAAPASVGN